MPGETPQQQAPTTYGQARPKGLPFAGSSCSAGSRLLAETLWDRARNQDERVATSRGRRLGWGLLSAGREGLCCSAGLPRRSCQVPPKQTSTGPLNFRAFTKEVSAAFCRQGTGGKTKTICWVWVSRRGRERTRLPHPPPTGQVTSQDAPRPKELQRKAQTRS